MSELFGLPGEIRQILATVQQTDQKVSQLMTEVSQQQTDINNAVAAITGMLTDIKAQNAQLATDLANLQAQLASGQPVDTSALDSAVAQVQATQTALDTAVQSITNLAPGSSTPPAGGTPTA